jgi:hypothetical protein
MMLRLSNNSMIRQIQLVELVETSKRTLAFLTSPVVVFDKETEVWHGDCSMYGKNMTGYDYQPPIARRGRLSNLSIVDMEFD